MAKTHNGDHQPADGGRRRLAEHLQELRLPAFREHYQNLAQRAAQEELSYPQYLEALADRECETRTQGRIQRLCDSVAVAAGQDLGAVPAGRGCRSTVTQQLQTLLRRLVPGPPGERAGVRASRVRGRRTALLRWARNWCVQGRRCCSRRAACWCRSCWRPNAT